MKHESHEAYFTSLTPEARARLEAIAAFVQELIPQAKPCIGYNMPAFRDKRIFFYFAAFKKHIGIYPPLRQDAALIERLQPYRGEKGNLSFVHSEELPLALIGEVALALYREYGM